MKLKFEMLPEQEINVIEKLITHGATVNSLPFMPSKEVKTKYSAYKFFNMKDCPDIVLSYMHFSNKNGNIIMVHSEYLYDAYHDDDYNDAIDDED